MSLFPAANASYIKFFGTSPPSRATVAVPLKRGRVRVEVIGFDDRLQETPSEDTEEAVGDGTAYVQRIGGRTGLHVQSLSYWAPANIGPYSQAVMVSRPLSGISGKWKSTRDGLP
jgi:diphthine-ammonia ligase